MKRIDEFVNNIYSNVNGKEAKELKEEMYSHLLETIEELKTEGKTEEEAINIALERFGDERYITKGLFNLFKEQNNIIKKLFRTSLIFLIIGGVFLIGLIVRDQVISQKNDNILSTVENVINNLDSKNLSESKKNEIVNLTVKQLKLESFVLYKKPEGSPNKFKDSSFPEIYSKMDQVVGYGGSTSVQNARVENKNWYAEFKYKELPFYAPFYAIPYSLLIISAVLALVVLYLKHRSERKSLHILLKA